MLTCIWDQDYIEGQGHFVGHTYIIYIYVHKFLKLTHTAMELAENIHQNMLTSMIVIIEVKVIQEVTFMYQILWILKEDCCNGLLLQTWSFKYLLDPACWCITCFQDIPKQGACNASLS